MGAGGRTVSDYRIVCVNRLDTSAAHCHVTDIGTTTERGSRRWSAVEMRAAISSGDHFFTVSPTTGETATVEPYDCRCGLKTVRSGPDAIADNNLAAMPDCGRKQASARRLEIQE